MEDEGNSEERRLGTSGQLLIEGRTEDSRGRAGVPAGKTVELSEVATRQRAGLVRNRANMGEQR